MVTVGVNYPIDQPTDIYVMIDPDDEINNEITTFNNVAHTTLPKQEDAEKPTMLKFTGSFRGGRGR